MAVPPRILHLDVDSFFAAVEQRDDARLRGRPVAVGSGVVASCSVEAKHEGVTTGMALGEARRRCPRLLVLPGDYRRYEQASRRILGVCHDLTPIVEVAALDDLYLDMTQPLPESTTERQAHELRTRVRTEVGLSVSLGLGGSKLVARTATRQAKRRAGRGQDGKDDTGAVVRVPAGTERDFLAPWSMEILPGAGGRIRARLERLNVHRVGEVAEMPLAVLCGLFGQRGRTLRDQARGVDPRPVLPSRPQQSVGRRTSFDPACGEPDFLRAMLGHLLERAVSWLRFQGLATRGLRLLLRYADHRSEEGRVAFRKATLDETELKTAAVDRFARLYVRRIPLRLLGVELAPLVAPDGQGQLFPDADAEKARRLTECKDAVRQRFGFMSLVSGTTLTLAGRIEHDRDNFRLRTPCLTR
jgi:DNA polymerase-4